MPWRVEIPQESGKRLFYPEPLLICSAVHTSWKKNEEYLEEKKTLSCIIQEIRKWPEGVCTIFVSKSVL